MAKKKWKTAVTLGLVTGSVLLSACGTGENTEKTASKNEGTDFSGTEIEIATYLTGDTLEAYKSVIEGFEKETGAEVTLMNMAMIMKVP